MMAERIEQRLLRRKVTDRASGCWNFVGSTRRGYGRISVAGRTEDAHRAAYECFVCPVAIGIEVCHTCDNRRCINPAHLFLGTHAVNMRDCIDKGRFVYLKPMAGPDHPAAKLTPEQVREIRACPLSSTKVAALYGVGARHVRKLKSGDRYQLPELHP